MRYKTIGETGLLDAQEAIDLMFDMGNSLKRLISRPLRIGYLAVL